MSLNCVALAFRASGLTRSFDFDSTSGPKACQPLCLTVVPASLLVAVSLLTGGSLRIAELYVIKTNQYICITAARIRLHEDMSVKV